MQLTLLFPSELTQKYGYHVLIEPLLDDIKVLESTGLCVKFEGKCHIFRGTVTMLLADNLAARALGGFYCNFSTVQRFCRFCNATKQGLIDDCNKKDWVLRTRESYDLNIRHLLDDTLMTSAYGLKSNSCLNEVQFLHVIEGLPPDVAHDVFEGFSVDLISNALESLVTQNKFSLQEFNNILSRFKYARIDKANKPQPLKIISGISFKLQETACEMWNLIRLLPLII